MKNKDKFINLRTSLLLPFMFLFASMEMSQANSLKVINKTNYPISVKNIDYLKGNGKDFFQSLGTFENRRTGNYLWNSPDKAIKDGSITKGLFDAPAKLNPVKAKSEAEENWGDNYAVGYQSYNKVSYYISKSGVEKKLDFQLHDYYGKIDDWKPFLDEDKAKNAETTPRIKIDTTANKNTNLARIYSDTGYYADYTVTFEELPPLELRKRMADIKPVTEKTGPRQLTPDQGVTDSAVEYHNNNWIFKNETGKNLKVTVNAFSTTLNAGEKQEKIISLPGYDVTFSIEIDGQAVPFPSGSTKIDKRYKPQSEANLWRPHSNPMRFRGKADDQFFNIELKPQYFWKQIGVMQKKWFVDYEVRVYPDR